MEGLYRYERLSENNIHHLIPLFKELFRKNIPLDFLLSKYNTTYTGKSYLGHIAFDGKRPVAYGGFVPHIIQCGENIEIGAQSADSMSLPELSGKGVFKKIYFLNEELLINEGIHFGYGFGNQDSVPVFVNKFNWYTKENLQVFMVPVNGIPQARILNKIGLKDTLNKRIHSVLEPYMVNEIFTNPFAGSQNGFTVYNNEFFHYKSGYHRKIISIDGIKVWIKTENRLSVGSIESCSEKELLKVVEQLVKIAKEIGFSEVLFQYSPGTREAEILRKKYNVIEGSPICFKVFESSISMDKLRFANSDLDTF